MTRRPNQADATAISDAELCARLQLLRSRRVGPATWHRMMAEHGNAQAALAALPGVARTAGLADYAPCPEGVVRAELRAARKAGAQLLWIEDTAYPPGLRQMEDAPPMLWAIGRLDLATRDAIALVGARNASSLGLRMARSMAEGLSSEGYAVASGLARGVDARAHEGALQGGTIAVVGGGADVVYPRENADLRARISEQGLILSEQPMGLAPMARHFPKRNRLISGLARAVVVVEAAARSGSLHTARTALDQGREVMAVPGHPMDGRAGGTNLLIRDGATLVRGADDILAALPPDGWPDHYTTGQDTTATSMPLFAHQSPPPAPAIQPGDARDAARRADAAQTAGAPSRLERQIPLTQIILSRLGAAPIPEDDLLRTLPGSASEHAGALVELELAGQVERQPGGLLTRIT